MFSYPRLGTETRPSVYSMCNAADEPCPLYHSVGGYTNGTLHFGARDGLRTTLHFGITDGLIRKRKGAHLRTSSDQREEERVDQTSDPPGPDNQPK